MGVKEKFDKIVNKRNDIFSTVVIFMAGVYLLILDFGDFKSATFIGAIALLLIATVHFVDGVTNRWK